MHIVYVDVILMIYKCVYIYIYIYVSIHNLCFDILRFFHILLFSSVNKQGFNVCLHTLGGTESTVVQQCIT